MLSRFRLAENNADTLGDSVCCQHDSALDLVDYIGPFLISQSRDEFRRRFTRANTTLGGWVWLDHSKSIAMAGQ
jgi:hypothetical protein